MSEPRRLEVAVYASLIDGDIVSLPREFARVPYEDWYKPGMSVMCVPLIAWGALHPSISGLMLDLALLQEREAVEERCTDMDRFARERG